MTIERLTDAQAMELLEKRRQLLTGSLKGAIEMVVFYQGQRVNVENEIAVVDRAMDLFLRNGAAQ